MFVRDINIMRFFLTDAPSIHKITANLGYMSVNDDELEIFAFKKRMKLCVHTWQDSQCESSHILKSRIYAETDRSGSRIASGRSR